LKSFGKMRDHEIIGLQEAYLEVCEEVDTRRAPKEMIDRLNASREGHMAQDGPNKPAYDAKQRLLKKAHKKRTQVSEAQEGGRRARRRKPSKSVEQLKAEISARDEAKAQRATERAAARRPLTPGERYDQEKAAKKDKSGGFSQHRMTGSGGHGSTYSVPSRFKEEFVVNYLLDEGFASDEKSAEAIMGAMSEAWVESIVEEVLDEELSGSRKGKASEILNRKLRDVETLRNLAGRKRTQKTDYGSGNKAARKAGKEVKDSRIVQSDN
jgi:hypothetical protein